MFLWSPFHFFQLDKATDRREGALAQSSTHSFYDGKVSLMCSRITCVMLLNVHDQCMNNFDISKHVRLTRV
jgi:hypothetical protein